MIGQTHCFRDAYSSRQSYCRLPLVLGLILAFTGFPARADVYENCQALLVDGTIAQQQADALDQVLKKFVYKDAKPAYFAIGKYKLAIIPSDGYSSVEDLIPIEDALENINDEWRTRAGNVSLIEEIEINNLPLWTGRFASAAALGGFVLWPFAQGQPTVTIYSISTTIAALSYLFANSLDGPDVANTICRFFEKLDPLPGSFSSQALFVIKAPKNVITALKVFSHFPRNEVTYFPRPWIDQATYKKMQQAVGPQAPDNNAALDEQD